jgi:hypothetical protein
MSKYAKLPKQRTAADRERDMVTFLFCARPEKVAEHTPQMLADAFGVKLVVAEAAMQKMGRML